MQQHEHVQTCNALLSFWTSGICLGFAGTPALDRSDQIAACIATACMMSHASVIIVMGCPCVTVVCYCCFHRRAGYSLRTCQPRRRFHKGSNGYSAPEMMLSCPRPTHTTPGSLRPSKICQHCKLRSHNLSRQGHQGRRARSGAHLQSISSPIWKARAQRCPVPQHGTLRKFACRKCGSAVIAARN